jgi:transcriptional regulator with XRE-family HTH domain
MRRAREQRGISLRQIAAATKFSVAALEALERNDISRLPGGLFSRAFVRSYATEIGLDPDETIREFLVQFPHDSVTAGSPHVPQEDHAAIESERESAATAAMLIAISVPLVGIILYFTLWAGRTRSAPAPAPAGAPVQQGRVTAPEPMLFELVATSPVQVGIQVDEAVLDRRTLRAGERIEVAVQRGIQLTLSNAGAVHLTIDNKPAAALGADGEQKTVRIARENYAGFLAAR